MSESIAGNILWFYAVPKSDGTVTQYGHVHAENQPQLQAAIPAAVEITQDQFLALRAGGTFQIAGGALTPTQPSTPDLASAKAAALKTIDTAAERQRMRFLTGGSGQASEYAETIADARAVLGLTPALPMTLAPSAHPWVAAEQAALQSGGAVVTLVSVATRIVAQHQAWQIAGSAIKRVRRTAKLAVAAATTPAEVATILAGLTWPE